MNMLVPLTVLIVEDEALVREELVLTTPWERFGCTVIGEAEDGITGAEMIRTLSPDIVITDIRMPGKDGITILGDQELYPAIERICRSLRDERNRESLSDNDAASDLDANSDGDRQDHYVATACSFMQAHCGEDLALADVAGAVGITQSYLSRLFRQKTGSSFVESLRDIRIERAKELLIDRSLRVNEIARQVGFRDMSYFSTQFRRCVGVSPSAYLKGERSGGNGTDGRSSGAT